MKKILLFCIACIAIPFYALAQNAVRVKNINPTGNSKPTGFTEMNGKIYFAADDGVNGYELWSSDGTDAGTLMVKDIHPTGSGMPLTVEMLKFNNKLIFSANDGVSGKEIWISDGTAAGTQLLKDIRPASPTVGFAPHSFTICNNKVFFLANDGTTGMELWATDGTTAGTYLVKDIYAGATSSSANTPIRPIMVLKNKVYFLAKHPSYSDEIWYSDGTDAGTQLLKDINLFGSIVFDAAACPGTNRIGKNYVVYRDSLLMMSLDNGSGQRELWVTNGKAAGTRLFCDWGDPNDPLLNASSHPTNFSLDEDGNLCVTFNVVNYSSYRKGYFQQCTYQTPTYNLWQLKQTSLLSESTDDETILKVVDADYCDRRFIAIGNYGLQHLSHSIGGNFDAFTPPLAPRFFFKTNFYNNILYHNQIYFAGATWQSGSTNPDNLYRATIKGNTQPQASDSTYIDSLAYKLVVSTSIAQSAFGIANETLFFTAADLSGDLELYKIYTQPTSTETHTPKLTQLAVSPNPIAAGENLQFTLPESLTLINSELLLYDVLGRQVHQQIGTLQAKNTLTIPLTVAHGVYILQIRQNGQAVAFAKIVVE